MTVVIARARAVRAYASAMSETTATATEPRVTIDVANHVAEVRLSRPDKHNALDAAMFLGIEAAAAEVAATPGVRAVVLHGEGPSFCSGLDIASFMSGPISTSDLVAREGDEVANLAQRVAYDWTRLPVPVIAAVHGVCFGGGLQIALGADIRIAAPDAQLSVMEIRWGLVPDMAITQTLPRLVRSTSPGSSSTRAGASAARRPPSSGSRRGSPRTRSPRRASWPPTSRAGRPTRSARASAC